ncbi:MAG: DNA polymerase III subunit gamma/tau [Parvibaculales bacterium]
MTGNNMADPNDPAARPEDTLSQTDNQSHGTDMAEPEPPVFSDDAPGFDMLGEADAANEAASEAVDAPVAAPKAETGIGDSDDNGGSYKVLARKYRPTNFNDLIGQDAMVRTLTNAFETARIAHAFMLTGVRGVGKTTTARILARALNYQTETVSAPSVALDALGVHCQAIMEGTHVDVIEMDAASRTGIGDIREIIENVRYMPSSARYKVYIIDEVHMLSKAAFNGLLKTLEEPPEHVKFIFATTEIRQVPVTVLSRCQRFDLKRLDQSEAISLLQKVCAAEQVSLPEEALTLIARAADGSARDALSLLDRALAHGAGASGAGAADAAIDGETMRALLGLADRGRGFDLFDLTLSGDVAGALAEFDAQYALGADPSMIIASLAELTHWLTRLKFVADAGADVTYSADMRARGLAAAEKLSTRILSRVWQALLHGHQETLNASNPKAAAEMVLIRLAHLSDVPTPEELLKQWEAAQNSGSAAPSVPSTAAPEAPPSGQTAQAVSAQAARPASASGGTAGPVAQAAPMPEAPVAIAPQLNNFADIVALAAEKRDISLKHALESGVHLVNFEAARGDRQGRLEIRLNGAYDGLAQELTRKLRDWTGQHWVVSLSQAAGAQTIESTRQEAADRRQQSALADPHVQAAMAAFPGAEIVSITDFDMQADANGEMGDDSTDNLAESDDAETDMDA